MAVYFGETLETKYTLAETYFGVNSHIRSHDWANFTEDDKKAALIQSEREIDSYLAIVMDTCYDDINWPLDYRPNFRPDQAVFEQALYILDNTARTEDSSDGAAFIESASYQERERDDGVGVSPQAQRFLKLSRVQLDRG